MRVLSVDHVSYTYPQQNMPAVNDVDFSLERGSYTAIVGLNGSGKSTLARILCGLLDAECGEVSYASGVRSALVFQSPKDQIICSVVFRDTAFGPQNLALSPDEVELRTIESLTVVGLLHKAASPSVTLSLGQTQKEALAGIIAIDPDVIILDEALSMLDPDSKNDIFAFLSYWVRKGRTVVHITHDTDAIRKAQDVIAMEKGKIVYSGTTDDFFTDTELCERITGDGLVRSVLKKNNKKPTDLSAASNSLKAGTETCAAAVHTSPANATSIQTAAQETGTKACTADAAAKAEAALAFCNVGFSYGENVIFNNINFSLTKGTLTALTGVSGSGKSTLLEMAAGLLAPSYGEIRSDSRPALCRQNSDAALFERFAADDVAFGPGNRGVRGKALVSLVKRSMDEAGIPYAEYAERQTAELSGGEKRRLAVAGIIALDAPVLLFDEPTAGLDGPSRAKTMALLRSLAASGHTVLFSTHRPDEADFADEEISVRDGNLFLVRSNAASSNGGKIIKKGKSDADGAAGFDAQMKRHTLPDTVQMPLEGAKLLNSIRAASANTGNVKKNGGIAAKLPPAVKFIVFIALFAASLAVRPLSLCACMFLLSLIYAFSAKYPKRRLFLSLVKTVPLLLFFCIFQMIFYPPLEGERIFLAYRYFTVTPSKLLLCLTTLIRTEGAIACILSFSYTTPEYDIVDGLSVLLKPLAVFHIPVRYVIIITEIVFRFMPLLLDEASEIIKTQLIRGGLRDAKGFFGRVRSLIPLFVPLVMQTIRRSEALADALTERCFS
ncbi:ATP-binding cassette domain-containing protein [Treponema sp. Marseille-Q4130]|uniref:ATP-binding cassette domain-containing protein n=1 Tax=Treponema sp. Marseille-Q4130 TaxID=2766702 RepID=UPI001651BBDD|nr:ATP-binding cassette domain-containing protein [Treponema sp. Marseille-Q4130]MBC6719125.1 ATP-binding cassette domain-containing protein [Treponema sp. Marseille-Q4130]